MGTVSRIRQVWRLDQVRHREGQQLPLWVRRAPHHTAIPVSLGADEALERAAAALTGAGYRVCWEKDADHLFAEKGRYGAWGSVILHLSLMLILLGGAYSGAGRMSSYFELVEGQVFSERSGAFLQKDQGPLYQEPGQPLQVRLDRLQAEYRENGTLRDISSQVTLRGPQGDLKQRAISVDRPLSYQGATVYQAKRHGFAALLVLKDADGKALSSGLVHFALPKELTQPATNRFSLPKTWLQAEADFYPASGQGPIPARSWLGAPLDQPWLCLFLRDGQGKVVFQGPWAQGGTVAVGGYLLSVQGVSRWAGFPVVRDPGLPVIFAGFALRVLGAALTFLWAPTRV